MAGRRPIPSRDSGWAKRIARALAHAGVSPNQISVVSIGVAAIGATSLIASRDADTAVRITLLLVAALCIPMRLLCNLFDGMVAVEFGKASKSGGVFNELPDRISDVLLLVGAGYAVDRFDWAVDVAWAAAVLAVATAYIRALGSAIGAGDDFSGPFAKQQRMMVLAAGCVLAAIETGLDDGDIVMTCTVVLIAAGTAATAARRSWRLVRTLESQ